ncbi:hypothetical protein [Bradyrhizobium barranii]
MSDDLNPKLPILHAHAAAVMRVGKDAADACLVKHGASQGGPGAYRRIPEAKMEACISELNRLAAGPASDDESTHRAMQKMQRSAFSSTAG